MNTYCSHDYWYFGGYFRAWNENLIHHRHSTETRIVVSQAGLFYAHQKASFEARRVAITAVSTAEAKGTVFYCCSCGHADYASNAVVDALIRRAASAPGQPDSLRAVGGGNSSATPNNTSSSSTPSWLNVLRPPDNLTNYEPDVPLTGAPECKAGEHHFPAADSPTMSLLFALRMKSSSSTTTPTSRGLVSARSSALAVQSDGGDDGEMLDAASRAFLGGEVTGITMRCRLKRCTRCAYYTSNMKDCLLKSLPARWPISQRFLEALGRAGPLRLQEKDVCEDGDDDDEQRQAATTSSTATNTSTQQQRHQTTTFAAAAIASQIQQHHQQGSTNNYCNLTQQDLLAAPELLTRCGTPGCEKKLIGAHGAAPDDALQHHHLHISSIVTTTAALPHCTLTEAQLRRYPHVLLVCATEGCPYRIVENHPRLKR